MRAIVLLLLSVASLLACDSAPGDELCETDRVSGVLVTVTDSTSTAEICDATVFAQDGLYWELLLAIPATDAEPCKFAGVFERAGVYRIEGAKPGYGASSVGGLEVIQGECHLNQQVTTLSLTPNAAP